MMKMQGKRVMALGSALLMAACALTGCSGSSKGADSGSAAAGTGDHTAQIEAESDTVSFLVPGFDGTDATNHQYYTAIKSFEDKYGKKVNVLQVTGDQLWQDKVAANISSGDPIDVFSMDNGLFLTLYQKGYLSATDDYVDMNAEGNDLNVLDTYLKFDGRHYGAAGSVTPYVLYYNKDILVSCGFDADYPKECYENGTWTWDTFVKLARACTDKNSGIVGLQNMFDEVFQASNCAPAVKLDDSGHYELCIKEQAMRQTQELVQDIFYKNPVCGNGYITGQTQFVRGKAAMHGAYSYEEVNQFADYIKDGTMKFDLGVTAFPAGPSNPDKKNFAHASAFGISAGSKEPYSAGELINMIVEEGTKEAPDKDAKLMSGSKELYDTLAKNVYVPDYTDGILENGFGAFYLLYSARQGEDINEKTAEFETKYQKMVDDANALLK